jgi:hypothetical protein
VISAEVFEGIEVWDYSLDLSKMDNVAIAERKFIPADVPT